MVPITLPAPSDAAAIGTGKLTLRAGPRCAALLVRVISAVVVVVTLPTAWDTAVVFAAELVWLTGALITLFLGLI